MDLRAEIAVRVDALSPELQRRVLVFITALGSGRPAGTPPAGFRDLVGLLDPVSAREMSRAIEQDCERVDDSLW